MRRYRGDRREAIEWINYRRIHYIAASWFHPFSRVGRSVLLRTVPSVRAVYLITPSQPLVQVHVFFQPLPSLLVFLSVAESERIIQIRINIEFSLRNDYCEPDIHVWRRQCHQ